jgi:hypothetical protein
MKPEPDLGLSINSASFQEVGASNTQLLPVPPTESNLREFGTGLESIRGFQKRNHGGPGGSGSDAVKHDSFASLFDLLCWFRSGDCNEKVRFGRVIRPLISSEN